MNYGEDQETYDEEAYHEFDWKEEAGKFKEDGKLKKDSYGLK